MSVEITFMRHAQTTGNAAGRWQGHTNSSLTELGEQQAARLGKRLAAAHFDLVVASDLDRTMQTAAALGRATEPDPRWREPHFGDWEDHTTAEIMSKCPEQLAALFRGEDITPPGGEPLVEVVGRTREALEEIVARVGQGSVAIVSHGMSLLLLVATLLGTKRPTPLRLLANSATATAVIDDAGFTIVAYNDDTHLGHTALPHFGSSPEDTELLLIRHGRTHSNDEQRWQGHADGVLNEAGAEQARLLADYLPPIDALYSSPLTRAADTAAAIADRQGITVELNSKLKEIGFGAWEGMTRSEIAAAYPAEYEEFIAGDDVRRGGNGETFLEVRERMVSTIDEIAARHAGEEIGVVSHGGATRAYATGILGIPFENRNRLRGMDNTHYARMAFTGRGPSLVSWNLGPHLS